jgi:hypothetical protein
LEFSKKEQEQLPVEEYILILSMGEHAHLIKKAQELLHKHERTQAQKGGEVTQFAVNSYVLVRYPPSLQRRSQPPTKLHTNLRGPLKITKREGDSYWLMDIVTNKTRKRPIHVSRLVAFVYNPTHTSPLDVARRDLQEFFVHEILEHRYTSQSERKLTI